MGSLIDLFSRVRDLLALYRRHPGLWFFCRFLRLWFWLFERDQWWILRLLIRVFPLWSGMAEEALARSGRLPYRSPRFVP